MKIYNRINHSKIKDEVKIKNEKNPENISFEKLIDEYKIAYTSRALDKKMVILIKQGKSFFHIGCAGHEAIQIAIGDKLKKKKDWVYPYYRDQAFCLKMGEIPKDILLLFLGKRDDVNSAGRQMPQHYGYKKNNIVSSSSSTGTQYLQAVGTALANKLIYEKKKYKTSLYQKEITVVCSGDGTTSQGDFHEALNIASQEQLPIIFLIQNNRYAISVPIREQKACKQLSYHAEGYKNMFVMECDGTDVFLCHKIIEKAINKIRNGSGPILIEANVVRLLPHSSSDDQKKYRTFIELEYEKKKDPLSKMRNLLIKNNILTLNEISLIERNISKNIDIVSEMGLKQSDPKVSTLMENISDETKKETIIKKIIDEDSEEYVIIDAINKALVDTMKKDNKILVFGEDVAHGKGGVFTATRGITTKFGSDRCFNTSLAESSIVGMAIGLAIRGFKPIPEIQFGDYIWTAMMQIRNELSTIRYRSNGEFKSPVVLRIPIGGYIHGGLCHSQNIEGTFSHFPGLKIAMPSMAIDAYGLLKKSILGNDPVLFLEHKALYRQAFAKSKLPKNEDWVQNFGQAKVRKEGFDLTIITYGMMVQKTIEASKLIEEENITVEIIDLRTIKPYDWKTIEKSIKKTSRVLVIQEDTRFMGFGAEIAAEVGEKLYEYLDAPIVRLSGKDIPVPFNSELEKNALPQVNTIVEAIYNILLY